MFVIDSTCWQEISPLLDELLDADAAQRAARLEWLRARNPAWADALVALLAQQGAIERERFLDGTALPGILRPVTCAIDDAHQQHWFAEVIHLLAVRLTGFGLPDKAIQALQTALALEPGLELARFHLAMLLLDSNRRSEAREHFSALRDGSLDAALRRYAEAMIALSDDDRRVARKRLMLGLSQRTGSPVLANEMRCLLDGLSQSDEAAVSGCLRRVAMHGCVN
jgi:hypothetical protein